MKKNFLSAAFMLLVIPAVFNSNDISAQAVSVKVGTEKDNEKKKNLRRRLLRSQARHSNRNSRKFSG